MGIGRLTVVADEDWKVSSENVKIKQKWRGFSMIEKWGWTPASDTGMPRVKIQSQ